MKTSQKKRYMNPENSISEIAGLLSTLDQVVLVSHYNPDPDAYGSMCGLGLALQAAGKEVVCVNESEVIERYSSFPGIQLVQQTLPEWEKPHVVACDCGDFHRVGATLEEGLSREDVTIINIDHHFSNTRFGRYNLVLDEASSTAEIVFSLLKEMNLAPGQEAAEAIFCGLMSDTGSFRYSNTGQKTFQVAAELIGSGVNAAEMAELLYGSVRLAAVKLQSLALGNLTTYFDGQMAEVVVPESMYAECGAEPFDTENLVERARDIQGVRVAAFIGWSDGIWKVSLRSVHERYDVSSIAQSFGGGGHRCAAAFRSRRELQAVRDTLKERVGQILGGGNE